MTNEEKLIADYVRITENDTYRIKLTKTETSILDDKLGGIPYLPVNEEYPVDASGNKMALFMQINLANIELNNFPKKGIMEIFISTDDEIFKYNVEGNMLIKIYESDVDYQKDLEYIELPFLNGIHKIEIIKEKQARSFDRDESYNLLVNLIKEYNLNKKPLDFQKKIDYEIINNIDHLGGYVNLGYYDNGHDLVSNNDECLFYFNTETDSFLDMGSICAIYATINKDKLANGEINCFEFNISFD